MNALQPSYPTPQQVFIKTDNANINVNVPDLQQFYTNVSYDNNQDYAYYQLSYVDVPQENDIKEILGVQFDIFVTVNVAYKQIVAPDNSTPTSFDTNDGFLNCYGQFKLTIPIYDTMNTEQIATSIRTALFGASQFYPFRPAPLAGTGDVTSDAHNTIFFAHLQDFIYDPATQKYAFVFAPSDVARLNRYPSTTVDTSNEVFYINVGFNHSDKYNAQQRRLWGALMGGVVSGPNQDIVRVSFDLRTEAERNAYHKLVQAKFTKTVTEYIPISLIDGANAQLLDTVQYLFAMTGFTQIVVYGEMSPRLTIDNYVFVRTNAGSSMWYANGQQSNCLAIVPRNRAYGAQVQPESAYIYSNHMIKAPLAAIRNMRLQLTDSRGDPLVFRGSATLVITIFFNIQAPKE